MTTYPLPTLAAVVSATGIAAPAFSDIVASLKKSFQTIYGEDVYLEPDSQDGQLLDIFAKAINDANNTTIAVYNAYSPATAQGAALSSAVKINGLSRLVPTNSTADVTLVGIAGTTVTNGVVRDASGNNWSLPSSVEIPLGGSVVATATAQSQGAFTAPANTITTIATPTYGWQSVTNLAAAVAGNPVETDYALRLRQTASTALAALTVVEALYGALSNLAGVVALKIFVNNTGSADGNGIPAHAVSVVIEGGDATAIATTIANKLTPGTPTYGSTSITVLDRVGVPRTVNFYRPVVATISATISLHPLNGYSASTGAAVIAAVAAGINAAGINANSGTLYRNTLIGDAMAAGPTGTYNIADIQLAISPAAVSSADVAIAFNAIPAPAASLTLNLV